MTELYNAMTMSTYGMKAQSRRVRVITENVANAATLPDAPGKEPYRRKMVTFKNELDRQTGLKLVDTSEIRTDNATPFKLKYMPGHPAADENGYVQAPNINTLVEVMDLREAQRSYEANLGMIRQSRTMLLQTIDLLRN